jgi:hypothetical protein
VFKTSNPITAPKRAGGGGVAMDKYQIMENELLYMHAALQMTVNKAQDTVLHMAEDRNMMEGE